MEIEFRAYRANRLYEDEYFLSKEPLKMDRLVIKKDNDISITSYIGDIFKTHNI